VLIIEERPNGQLTHSWRPVEGFDLSLERLRPQEFTVVDGAVDWLKRHRTSILVGSIIVIAGVTFVVVSAGAGVVVLAPVVLMTAAEAQSGDPVAEGPR
jgi:hypothetical protein